MPSLGFIWEVAFGLKMSLEIRVGICRFVYNRYICNMRTGNSKYENKHPFLRRIDEKGIKQSFLAEKLDMSRSRLNNYLMGIRPMPDWVKDSLEELIG